MNVKGKITVVVGGQYGGEGKGKVCAYLTHKEAFRATARCGGPNSSHSVVVNGQRHRLRMMPVAAAVRPDIPVIFGPGTLIHLATLKAEIEQIGYRGRVIIDPKAGIVTPEIVSAQRADQRYESIGSTLTGTGYASAERCLRRLPLAKDFKDKLSHVFSRQVRLENTAVYIYEDVLSKGGDLLVEGHQGYGLSNYHGDYPFCSSRDATAAAMLSELGLGMKFCSRVILTVKAFPTRNHSGLLESELSEKDADVMGIREFGGGSWDGVPDRRRRVGVFDPSIVRAAAIANSPTDIAVTGVDYLEATNKHATSRADLDKSTRMLIATIERVTGVRVSIISTGPETEAVIDLRELGPRKNLSVGQTEKSDSYTPDLLGFQ